MASETISPDCGGKDDNAVYFLGRIAKMAFMKPVTPGDQLITTIAVVKSLGGMALVSAESKVGDTIVARGEMSFGVGRNDAVQD